MDGQLVRAERVSRRVCVKDWVPDRTVCGEATFMLNHIFPVVPEPRVHRLLWSGFTSDDRSSRFSNSLQNALMGMKMKQNLKVVKVKVTVWF